MYKIIFLVATVLLMATACRSTRLAVTSSITTDSTTERTVVPRDTNILAPAAAVNRLLPVGLLQNGFVAKEVKYNQARLNIHVKDDTVYVACDCDTLAIRAQIRDYYEKTYKNTSRIDTVILPPEKYVPWWVKVLAWIGGLSIVAVGFFLISKLK